MRKQWKRGKKIEKQLKYKMYFKMFIKKNWFGKKKGLYTKRLGSAILQLKETCRLQSYQLNAISRVVTYYCTKEKSHVVFPNINFCVPLTKKSTGVRMGKGKGKPRHWCANFLKGTNLAEIEYIPYKGSFYGLKQLSFRLPARAKMLFRNHWLDKIVPY